MEVNVFLLSIGHVPRPLPKRYPKVAALRLLVLIGGVIDGREPISHFVESLLALRRNLYESSGGLALSRRSRRHAAMIAQSC